MHKKHDDESCHSTHFKVIEGLKDYTVVSLQLRLRQAHQISVHMRYLDFARLSAYQLC
ncbi:hypothetical protein [Carnobacterium maltaromaticum]|uniref:hypothetical protein n=1 Tax=Carnobacterium maltaromaticum TaxID=2751 RepID=UPI0039BE9129